MGELRQLNEQNKVAVWAERVTECRNSGQSVLAWCKEHGICSQTYYKWQKRLFTMAEAQHEVQFAEVTPITETPLSRNPRPLLPYQFMSKGLIHADRDRHTLQWRGAVHFDNQPSRPRQSLFTGEFKRALSCPCSYLFASSSSRYEIRICTTSCMSVSVIPHISLIRSIRYPTVFLCRYKTSAVLFRLLSHSKKF